MSGSAKVGLSPKEVIWLRAALTLPAYDCLCALDDIASMSCRTVSDIKSKAKSLAAEAQVRIDRKKAERVHFKRGLMVDANSVPPELRAMPKREAG